MLTFLARDAEQRVISYARAGIAKADQAEEIVRFVDKRTYNPFLVSSRLADTPAPMPWFGNKFLELRFT